jgi:biofilm PGA synthesis N-glycosyltransferase PgaC
MTITIIILILIYILSFLVIWQFVGYPALMALISIRNNQKSKKKYSSQLFISILVPTYNEAYNINERIKNLDDLDYPHDKYEIIVVDSGSNDDTREIVRNKIIGRVGKSQLKLVTEKMRKGKASAINFGKKYAHGDIILVTDANSIFDGNVLREMTPHFDNPNIGAVGGRHVLPNQGSSITSSNQFYLDLEYIMRKGEAVLDSACLFHGEINAWRKNIVDADTRMLSEDLDMAIHIRKKGFKVEYEPEAIFYEPSPTTVNDLVIQKKRTSIGTIQTIFKYSKYWLSFKDYYSFLIFPSHKALPMFSPLFLGAIIILYLLTLDWKIIIINLFVTMTIFLMFFIFLTYLKSKLVKYNQKYVISIKSVPNIVYYVLLNEWIILKAWKDFLFGKYSVLWQKVGTTRTG